MSKDRWRLGAQLGMAGPLTIIKLGGPPEVQGPLLKLAAALVTAMATAAARYVAFTPPPLPFLALLPPMKLCSDSLHRLGGSAPCTAEPEGRSVGSVSSTDSTQNPGSAHP